MKRITTLAILAVLSSVLIHRFHDGRDASKGGFVDGDGRAAEVGADVAQNRQTFVTEEPLAGKPFAGGIAEEVSSISRSGYSGVVVGSGSATPVKRFALCMFPPSVDVDHSPNLIALHGKGTGFVSSPASGLAFDSEDGLFTLLYDKDQVAALKELDPSGREVTVMCVTGWGSCDVRCASVRAPAVALGIVHDLGVIRLGSGPEVRGRVVVETNLASVPCQLPSGETVHLEDGSGIPGVQVYVTFPSGDVTGIKLRSSTESSNRGSYRAVGLRYFGACVQDLRVEVEFAPRLFPGYAVAVRADTIRSVGPIAVLDAQRGGAADFIVSVRKPDRTRLVTGIRVHASRPRGPFSYRVLSGDRILGGSTRLLPLCAGENELPFMTPFNLVSSGVTLEVRLHDGSNEFARVPLRPRFRDEQGTTLGGDIGNWERGTMVVGRVETTESSREMTAALACQGHDCTITRMGSDGELVLHAVPPGSYTMVIRDGDGRSIKKSIEVTGDDRTMDLGVLAFP